jgi:hypothetical protein
VEAEVRMNATALIEVRFRMTRRLAVSLQSTLWRCLVENK